MIKNTIILIATGLFVIGLSYTIYVFAKRDARICAPLLKLELLTQLQAEEYGRYNCRMKK